MNKPVVKVLLLLLCCVLACAAVELPDQLYLFSLPDGCRGTLTFLPDAAGQTLAPAGESAPDAEPVEAEVVPGAAITLPYAGYVKDLTIYSTLSESQQYAVELVLPDGSVETMQTGMLGMLGQNTLRVGKTVQEIRLTGAESYLYVAKAAIENGLRLNGSRVFLTFLLTLAAGLLLLLGKTLGKRPEVGFLIVALAAGLFLSICLPVNTSLCYDDQNHYARLQMLSHGLEGQTDAATLAMSDMDYRVLLTDNGSGTIYFDHNKQAYHHLLDTIAENAGKPQQEDIQHRFSDVGYATQTLGYTLARLLGLPFHLQLIAARVCNMLTYVLLTFAGLCVLKRYKLLLSGFALMPTAVYLSSNLSYDPTVNGMCFCGLALVVQAILDRDVLLTRKRGLLILLTLTLGSVIKIVYAPLLLLVLLLPRSKFATNGQRRWFKALAVLLCVFIVLSMLVSVAGDVHVVEDDRGLNVDTAAQIQYVLHNPITYLTIFFQSVWGSLRAFFVDECRTSLSYLGEVSGAMSILSLITLLLSVVLDSAGLARQGLNWYQKLFGLLVVCMVVGATYTSMYMAFSAVGSPVFIGLQGRYFIPVLPLIYLFISPNVLPGRLRRDYAAQAVYLLNLGILGFVCWVYILLPYYL